MRIKPRKISTAEHHRHIYGTMPPLQHWDRQGHFRGENSAVCMWLATVGPNIALPVLFARAQDACAIIFDAKAGLWRGCHFVEPGKGKEGSDDEDAVLPASEPTKSSATREPTIPAKGEPEAPLARRQGKRPRSRREATEL